MNKEDTRKLIQADYGEISRNEKIPVKNDCRLRGNFKKRKIYPLGTASLQSFYLHYSMFGHDFNSSKEV